MVVRGLVLLCPSQPLDTAALSRSEGGGEGRVLRGLVLLCPFPPSLILLRSLVLTVEGNVCSYGVWYTCAPSLPHDMAAFSRLTVEGRVGSYGVWYFCAPSLPFDNAVFSRFGS